MKKKNWMVIGRTEEVERKVEKKIQEHLAPSNPQRRINGRLFLDMAETTYGNGSLTDSLTDMLTDLRHYCVQAKIDFDKCVMMSEIHHNDERGGKGYGR